MRIDLIDQHEARFQFRISGLRIDIVQALKQDSNPVQDRTHTLADAIERNLAVTRIHIYGPKSGIEARKFDVPPSWYHISDELLKGCQHLCFAPRTILLRAQHYVHDPLLQVVEPSLYSALGESVCFLDRLSGWFPACS